LYDPACPPRRHLPLLFAKLAGAAAIASSLLGTTIASADENYLLTLKQRAAANELHDRIEWLSLGHYSPGLTGGHVSRAASPSFFLSDNGKNDPGAELAATLDAFFRPLTSDDANSTAQHPQCTFPARFAWLSEVLAIDSSRVPHPECTAFNKWFAEVAPRAATLIFAANYFNNPSSMFGHTLLRIDQSEPIADPGGVRSLRSPLNAYAINYTAQAGDDNAAAFTIKAFFGKYPGYFSLLPYYEKVKEYSDFESRDLWEYTLELDSEEVQRLVRHAWELDHVRFDYYFLDENCAYQLLALIDVARPGRKLTEKARNIVIPSDTVRLLGDEGFINQATYRASRQSRIRHALAQLDSGGRDVAFRLASDMAPAALLDTQNLTPMQRSIALDAAYEYLQHRYTYFQQERRPVAERAMAILAEQNRTAVNVTSPPSPPAAPQRPDLGHGTRSAGVALGSADAARGPARTFVDLRLRNGYHDFLDPSEGFASGAKINFLDLLIRHDIDEHDVRIEDIRLIEVHTIAPRDRFFAERSWMASLGFTRQGPLRDLVTGDDATPPLDMDFRGGWGLSAAPYANAIVFAQPEIHLVHQTRFANNLAAGAGGGVGLHLDLPSRVKVHATSSALRYRDLPDWRIGHDIGIGYGLGKNSSLQVFFHSERGGSTPWGRVAVDEIKTGLVFYF
jgi:hypothetical protein